MKTSGHILIIDDEASLRQTLARILQRAGHEVTTASTGTEGLSLLGAQSFDLLYLDIRMPDISGLELLEKLRRDDVMLPVIIITAHARTAITVKAIQQGAVTLLDKPYHEDELWDAITLALANDRKQRQEAACKITARQKLAALTDKERDVMKLVAAGEANKVIAKKLDVSERTVENRRRAVYEKLGVESVAEMMRVLLLAEEPGP